MFYCLLYIDDKRVILSKNFVLNQYNFSTFLYCFSNSELLLTNFKSIFKYVTASYESYYLNGRPFFHHFYSKHPQVE
jgi:hypothetical protein